MKKYTKYIALLAIIILPVIVFADAGGKDLKAIVEIILSYFGLAVRAILSLAVLVFIWNVYRYFFKADVENKKDAGLYVMYSVIGFFVILSIWGLVNLLQNTFELENNVPTIFGGIGGGGANRTSDFIQNTGGKGSL